MARIQLENVDLEFHVGAERHDTLNSVLAQGFGLRRRRKVPRTVAALQSVSLSIAAASDFLRGGSGHDTLQGDGESDTKEGGSGADLFLFYDSTHGGTETDEVQDFSSIDKIGIDQVVADLRAKGDI